MNMRKLCVLVSVLVGLVGTAQAQDSSATASTDTVDTSGDSGKKISAALLLGYGASLESGGNWYGFGLGARGGYQITNEIYLGGKFQYQFGTSITSLFLFGVEGGYNFGIADKLTLRPEVGLGLAFSSVDIPTVFGVGGSASSTDLYFEPGAVLLYDVAPDFFVGLNLSIPIILASGSSAGIVFLATGGMRF